MVRTRVVSLLLLLLAFTAVERAEAQEGTGTVIIDASSFIDEIPRGHTIATAAALGVPWLFNDFGLRLQTRASNMTRVEILEAGRYYLYVRSQGEERSTLRVAIGEQVMGEDVGNEPMRLRRAGTFNLSQGMVDVKLMGVDNSPVLDVIVLSTNPVLTEEDLKPLQGHPDVMVLREYEIPRASTAKFGDLTGDGRTDFVVLTRDYSAHAFDHAGNLLWSYEAPEEGASARASFEAPGLVWDLDRNGSAEVIHWRQEGDVEWLVVADGRTGTVKYRTPWPTQPLPHDYSNFRLSIANLGTGYPSHVLVYTDAGVYSERDANSSIAAYDAQLNQVWEHRVDLLKDHLGHYAYPVDITGDGVDEVVVSMLVLDAAGREIWNRFDLFYRNHDHADSFRFADLNGDGRLNMVTAHSEFGVAAFDGLTGRMIWQNVAEHTQQIEVGHFLDGIPGFHVAAGARTYNPLAAQVHWFDAAGNLIRKWPANPLNGNPVFVKGDWYGDGTEALFWYKFRMEGDGRGVFHFPETVYHMFDFTGDGAEEVITIAPGRLRVYGSASARRSDQPVVRSPEYLKDHVANHTHY